MDRRTFIGAAAANLAAVPFWALGQPNITVRRIGLLTDDEEPNSQLRGIVPSLRDHGWIEGRNLIVEARYADNQVARLPALAAELVHLNVDLIATQGTPAAVAAKNATATIPIVMFSAGDPVRAGLVASLAHPGGNVTGYSVVSTELRFKRLQLLRELVPTATRVGELLNPQNPVFGIARDEYEHAYRSLNLEPIFVEVTAASQVEAAVAEVVRRRGQALIVPTSEPIFSANGRRIMTAALRFALPTLGNGPDALEAGALASYFPSIEGHERRVAVYIDKILKGARPADLPIEQPTKFVLGINLKTAKRLGITIPQSLLLRADEVIQ
jgi:putative tryptophan/tyrosine transport system substrate-binding protein